MKAFEKLAGLAIAAVVLSAAPLAQGAILLSDNFDGYADQTAFQTAWPVVGTQPSATLSSAQSVSPPNSVNVAVSVDTPTSQRNQRLFAESGVPTAANPVTFSFDFFDSNAAASPYRAHANIQDGTGASAAGQLVSMGLNNNMLSTEDGGNYYMARILGYDGAIGVPGGDGVGAFFKLNQGAAPLRSTGWHNLKAVISPTDITFYVDGILSATEVTTVSNNDSFDVVRLGSGVSSPQTSYYDNVVVHTDPVPEPASLAGIVLGALLITRRRPRK